MKVAVMQPYFFPYIGYWQLLESVDAFVIYDDVSYFKRGWINRNRIIYQNKTRFFNVYLKGASQNKRINEIKVNREDNLNANNLLILKDAYKNAPMFQKVYPVLEDIIGQDEENLARYLGSLIKKVGNYLGIDTRLLYSSEIKKDNNLRGQDKIIEICKILAADQYINAIGGKNLYEGEVFSQNGIKLYFLQSNALKYQQFNNEFEENLSIVDVMMFNPIERIKEFLKAYELLEG